MASTIAMNTALRTGIAGLVNHAAIVLRGHDDDVYRARFSADEHSVATPSQEGNARVWSMIRRAPPNAAVYVEQDPIEGMWFDAGQLVVRTTTSAARWDLASAARALMSSWANESHNLGYGIASYEGDHVAP